MATITSTAIRIPTTMTTDAGKRVRLQSWFSPAFPIGAFSYSHGLEWAVQDGAVTDRISLVAWLEADLRHGSGRVDAMFFAQAWGAASGGAPSSTRLAGGALSREGRGRERAAMPHALSRVPKSGLPGFAKNSPKTKHSKQAFVGQPRNARLVGSEASAATSATSEACPLPLRERAATQSPGEGGLATGIAASAPPPPDLTAVAELAAVMRGTSELALESGQQGIAFLAAVRKVWPHPELDRLAHLLSQAAITPVLPVAAAICCAVHGIDLNLALPLYIHGAAANFVHAAVRLVPLGQTDGQIALAALEAAVLDTAREAAAADPEDIGSAAFMVDLASMAHETQYTRLFRS